MLTPPVFQSLVQVQQVLYIRPHVLSAEQRVAMHAEDLPGAWYSPVIRPRLH